MLALDFGKVTLVHRLEARWLEIQVRGTRGDRSRDSGDETKSDAIWISAGEPMNAFSSSLMPGCALARVDGQHGD